MLKTILLSFIAVLLAGAGFSGWIWYDLVRIHGSTSPIEFQSADGTILRGEIYLPKGNGPFPAIEILHGSGPHVASMPVYKIHATAFLKKDVAVLVYDKRGAGRSGGDFDKATYADFIEDALAGLQALRRNPHIDDDRIGLFGSSEGGWFTPEIAVRDGRVSYIVNRAGPAASWIDTNLWEIRHELLAGNVDKNSIDKIIDLRVRIWTYYRDALEAKDPLPIRRAALIADLKALDGPWRDIYTMRVAEFNLENYRRWCGDIFYDPRPYLKQMTQPLLAIYAGADQNVPTQESVSYLEILRAQDGKDITVKVYPGRDHSMFK